MATRWKILGLLFAIRTMMALQYQAAAALSPFAIESYGVGLADIGLLIGLYLSPGIFIALPGGALGKRFGDKQVVALGMAAMLAGAIIMAFVPIWHAQIGARLVAGIGGVILNVLMTKMVTDWFKDSGLATAMGIFVNSWPVGIAIGLLVLPPAAASIGVTATLAGLAGIIAAGLIALVAAYRSPDELDTGPAATSARLGSRALFGLTLAALIWALYNSALSMVFSFGPTLLTEVGWSVSSASQATSLTLWIVTLSVPLGGFLADRFGRRDLILAVGLSSFAVLLLITPLGTDLFFFFILMGAVGGLAAGPIMSMPADVLAPSNRAFGMGIFFTVYYFSMFLAPIGAGRLADTAANTEIAFVFGGILLVVCMVLLAAFKLVTSRTPSVSADR